MVSVPAAKVASTPCCCSDTSAVGSATADDGTFSGLLLKPVIDFTGEC